MFLPSGETDKVTQILTGNIVYFQMVQTGENAFS